MNFFEITYLLNGSAIQKKVYRVLHELRIFELLKDYTPVLAGTLPLDLFVEGSDLDILCYVADQDRFSDNLKSWFGNYSNFIIEDKQVAAFSTVIARFEVSSFSIEIFGQAIPVKDQIGYRHLVAEYQILLHKGNAFKTQIIELKKSGMKTEPAFAMLLGLHGNPYDSLLRYTI